MTRFWVPPEFAEAHQLFEEEMLRDPEAEKPAVSCIYEDRRFTRFTNCLGWELTTWSCYAARGNSFLPKKKPFVPFTES